LKWRTLHNEELHDLYSSSNIIRMINSRGIGWAKHVARMREKRGLGGENLRERYHLEDLGVDGRIILNWIQDVGWEHALV
jgi:hypothetical protein